MLLYSIDGARVGAFFGHVSYHWGLPGNQTLSSVIIYVVKNILPCASRKKISFPKSQWFVSECWLCFNPLTPTIRITSRLWSWNIGLKGIRVNKLNGRDGLHFDSYWFIYLCCAKTEQNVWWHFCTFALSTDFLQIWSLISSKNFLY